MKTLSLFILFLLVGLCSCETVNPLCTDNYCVEGEIYPRAMLEKDAVFDDLSIDDATIVSTLTGIPVAPVATFVKASPSVQANQLEIEPWSRIDVIFDNPPTYVKVDHKDAWWEVVGETLSISPGRFGLGERWDPGILELTITWANGSHTLK